jgi:hypothetical protein
MHLKFDFLLSEIHKVFIQTDAAHKRYVLYFKRNITFAACFYSESHVNGLLIIMNFRNTFLCYVAVREPLFGYGLKELSLHLG